MNTADIAKIEMALGITLPEVYRNTIAGSSAPRLSELGIFDDAMLIIERTEEQRKGYGAAQPWPKQYVYIGDQEDACPYAMDCGSGVVIHSDHGSLTETLGEYASVATLANELLAET